MHQSSINGNPKKAPSTALASKVAVFQGSDVEVEDNVVAPKKHPVVSDGVKDLFDIFVRFDICPWGQDQRVNFVLL